MIMHMADALISPAVGGTLWAASAGLIAYSSTKIKQDIDDQKIPLMGVLGAFIFAAQMINFTIPGTGSSGHLGGGLILAVLLGPHAAFLTLSSVLTVQALFFADGGLLALGCNIFNLGFFPCYIAYPFIYKPLIGQNPSRNRLLFATFAAAIIGLQLGAFFVVLQTALSGISALPFKPFLLMMLPIHLAIGIVEGLATAAVVLFIRETRPDILNLNAPDAVTSISMKQILASFVIAAIITGGGLSWFASSHPDGLEWAMSKASGTEELESPDKKLYTSLSAFQEKTAVLPDYGFKETEASETGPVAPVHEEMSESWPTINTGTSVSGLVGGAATLIFSLLIGFGLRRRSPAV